MWNGHNISIKWKVRVERNCNVQAKEAFQVTMPYEAYNNSLWQVFLFVSHA